jgi:hypothetical protein
MTDRDAKRRLADWFRRWRVPLRKFLLGKGAIPAADLEDVAQEVFLRLMRYDRSELIEHPQPPPIIYRYRFPKRRPRLCQQPRTPNHNRTYKVQSWLRPTLAISSRSAM